MAGQELVSYLSIDIAKVFLRAYLEAAIFSSGGPKGVPIASVKHPKVRTEFKRLERGPNSQG